MYHNCIYKRCFCLALELCRWNSENVLRLEKVISYFCYDGESQRVKNDEFKCTVFVSAEYVTAKAWKMSTSQPSPSFLHHPAVWPAGWHFYLHPVRSLRNAACDRCTCVCWPRSLNIVALGWLLEKLSAFKPQKSSAVSPTEHHPQPILPLSVCLVSKPFIGGKNAAELWRRKDILATTSKAKSSK